MPPAFDHASLNLTLLDGMFIVHKISADEELPADVVNALTRSTGSTDFISITRTPEEISIVCNAASPPYAHDANDKWKCIKIRGPMHHGLTGILCDFTIPLKRAEIPIFAVSTWNTDYILIPMSKAEDAVRVLENDGWKFENKGNLQK